VRERTLPPGGLLSARRGVAAVVGAVLACAAVACDPARTPRVSRPDVVSTRNPEAAGARSMGPRRSNGNDSAEGGPKVGCPVTPAPVTNPAALFRAAFNGPSSTAPLYVLITLVAADGRAERTVAVPRNLLHGAIDYECSGGCNGSEMQLARETRRFRFSNPRAQQNVNPRYSEAQLRRVRDTLGRLSADEFRREALVEGRVGPTVGGVAPVQGPFYSLYPPPLPTLERIAMRDATAHVLLECGYLPGIRDISGALYVSAAVE